MYPGGAALTRKLLDQLRNDPSKIGPGGHFPLSGGPTGPVTYTPGPRPSVPFMPESQLGPQVINRGGLLNLPPQNPNAIASPAAIPGQSPSFNQAPGTTSALPPGHQFMPGLFNAGLMLMQRGGSRVAPIAQMIPSIFRLGK